MTAVAERDDPVVASECSPAVRDWELPAHAVSEQNRTIDDTLAWGFGTWTLEPDLVLWQDPGTSYQCAIARAPLGNLCGYIRVPITHPITQVFEHVPTHGGLTWADFCSPYGVDDYGHVWFGFDCGHAWDVIPAMRTWMLPRFGTTKPVYRDINYVTREVIELARLAWRIG